jgi:hypothetical protein
MVYRTPVELRSEIYSWWHGARVSDSTVNLERGELHGLEG